MQRTDKGFRHWVLLATLCLAGAGAHAEELIADIEGVGSTLTEEFEIEGPWLLDWRVTGDFANSIGIEVSLVESVMLNHVGVVIKSRRAGYGTKMFNDTGAFRFRVSATFAGWRLRVSKITEEEAAAMILVE